MNNLFVKGFIAGFVLLVAGFGLKALPNIPPVFNISFVNAGIIAIIISTFYSMRKKTVIQDERTKMVAAYSLSYSLYSTYIMISLLIWVHILRITPLTVPAVLLITMLFMACSTVLFKWYFNRRGDLG